MDKEVYVRLNSKVGDIELLLNDELIYVGELNASTLKMLPIIIIQHAKGRLICVDIPDKLDSLYLVYDYIATALMETSINAIIYRREYK